MIDLWRKQCEEAFRKTKEQKIKNKREKLTKKIETLQEQTISMTGKGRFHFEHPPREGTAMSLMTTWIAMAEAIIRQQRKKQQRYRI